jgi:Fe-S-cluster containining protein
MKAKLKRFLTSLLPVAENRRGECNRCGQCCKLPFPCPFLRFDEQGLSSCAVYYARPPSCRKYPRTAVENLTPDTCGFYFLSPEQMRDQIRAARPQPSQDLPAPTGAPAFERQ